MPEPYKPQSYDEFLEIVDRAPEHVEFMVQLPHIPGKRPLAAGVVGNLASHRYDVIARIEDAIHADQPIVYLTKR